MIRTHHSGIGQLAELNWEGEANRSVRLSPPEIEE
jgi:hypothetical protein